MTIAIDLHQLKGSAASPRDPVQGRINRNDFIQSLSDAVSRNPVAAALIGVGALWLFTGGSRISLFDAIRTSGEGAASATGGLAHAASAVGHKAGDTTSSAASGFSDTVSSTYESLGAATSRTAGMMARAGSSMRKASLNTGSDLLRTAQHDLASLYERQPLVLGAVSIAIGAGIAAAFPVTEIERRIAGEASEQVKAQASNLASDQLGKAQNVARRAIDEVKREVEGHL